MRNILPKKWCSMSKKGIMPIKYYFWIHDYLTILDRADQELLCYDNKKFNLDSSILNYFYKHMVKWLRFITCANLPSANDDISWSSASEHFSISTNGGIAPRWAIWTCMNHRLRKSTSELYKWLINHITSLQSYLIHLAIWICCGKLTK